MGASLYRLDTLCICLWVTSKIKKNNETLHSFESYAVIYVSAKKEKMVSKANALTLYKSHFSCVNPSTRCNKSGAQCFSEPLEQAHIL